MLLSAVSVLVVAQSIFEIPEGLMNNPVHILGNAVAPLHKRKEVKQFLCLITMQLRCMGEG